MSQTCITSRDSVSKDHQQTRTIKGNMSNTEITRVITREKVEEWLMQFHSNQATRAIIRKINQNSILDIYGIARSETHHSKFLAWLFNPNESHNTGELALRNLLNIAVRRGIEQNNQSKDFLSVKKTVLTSASLSSTSASNVQVLTESYVEAQGKKGAKGRIDILIQNVELGTEPINIVIENKIYSNEHDEQTTTYFEGINKKFPKPKNRNIFLYLTPKSNWEMPKEDGPSCTCKDFIEINYQDILTEVLTSILEEPISSATKIAIEDYIHCITSPSIHSKIYNTMAVDKETNEMLKKFWDANEDLIRAAIYAFASSEDEDSKDEINNLKEALDSYTISRDYTQYRINGQGTYSKNALVKEIVTRIIKKGGDVMGTLKNLDAKCTIRLLQTEDHYNREKKQAFELEYNDSFIYITNQWRIGNISSFIDAVNEDNTIDLLIEAIKK